MADLFNDAPFGMQPQRKPMGLFRSPALSGQNPTSTPIGGDGASRFSGDAFGAGQFPSSPRRGGAWGGQPISRPVTGAGPLKMASPLPPAGKRLNTPVANVPTEKGPYNYSGPTMNLLGMTDFAPQATPAASPLSGNPRFGGNFLDGLFGAGGGMGGRRLFL